MSAERTYTDYLVDILDAIVKTEQFIQGMTFDRFVQDDKTVFAVVRAFVDILGFRDLVQRSLDRPALQGQIRQLLREVVLARPVWERDSPVDVIEARLKRQGVADPKAEAARLVNEYAVAERGSSFSDSLVLSATLNDRAITGLVTSLLFLSRGLAELGKYARGALSPGLLCHEQDLCFGPALIAAYDLEKKVAVYPRVVFSPEAYAAAANLNLACALLQFGLGGDANCRYRSLVRRCVE